MNPYWEAVRMGVCRKCIDGDSMGKCRLPASEDCPLEVYFPRVVDALDDVKSDSFMPYVGAVRAHVCSQCHYQTADGVCERRETLECALDRYLPLVIEKLDSMKTFVD